MKQLWALIALIALYAILAARVARADEVHLLELNEFSLQTGKVVNYDDPYYTYADRGSASSEYWDTITQANFNLDLLKIGDTRLYWNNNVTGASTNERYRMVRWHWEGGLDFNKYAQVFWEHQSEHVLDAPGNGHFPMFNAYELRFVVYKRDRQ